MDHPAENSSEIMLPIIAEVQLPAIVLNSVFNTVDGAYHYDLQGQLTDGNNAATV